MSEIGNDENNRDIHSYAVSEDDFQWSDGNMEGDLADDSSSITSSLSTNHNEEEERNQQKTNYTGYEFLDRRLKKKYYFQHRQGASQSNEKHTGHEKDRIEGLHSAEMRRQRVLGMYGTGYAVRWTVSPKGRVGLMTPDREALSALRRNLPETPQERPEKNVEEMHVEPQAEVCNNIQGIIITTADYFVFHRSAFLSEKATQYYSLLLLDSKNFSHVLK